jgi:phosphate transport system substrate-binding protein
MYLAYNENSPSAAQVKEFIKFADSPEGREVIRSNGTVPYLEGLNLMKKKLHESRQAQRDQGVH